MDLGDAMAYANRSAPPGPRSGVSRERVDPTVGHGEVSVHRIVRHEALFCRVVMKGHHCLFVAANELS